jgi:hypothetical protein
MKYTDLKIGPKVFFISAQCNTPVEDVFITEINKNNNFSIERNGKTVFCEITNEVGVFNFATSDEEKDPKNYGILYLNKELIEQEERFHNIIFENEKQIQDLSLENNIY